MRTIAAMTRPTTPASTSPTSSGLVQLWKSGVRPMSETCSAAVPTMPTPATANQATCLRAWATSATPPMPIMAPMAGAMTLV